MNIHPLAYAESGRSYANFGQERVWWDTNPNLRYVIRDTQHCYNIMDYSILCGTSPVRFLLKGSDKAAGRNINTKRE